MPIASFSIDLFVIGQTAHNLEVSTTLSALQISDLSTVSVPAAGVNLVHHIL
jgi:hypothetical protein